MSTFVFLLNTTGLHQLYSRHILNINRPMHCVVSGKGSVNYIIARFARERDFLNECSVACVLEAHLHNKQGKNTKVSA